MLRRLALILLVALGLADSALPQQAVTLKSAIVALTDDPALRATFERGLAAKAIAHDYDAITSYDFAPDVKDVDNRRFLSGLATVGARAVLMVRPAAIGAGSSLESVRNEVSSELIADMRAFAGEVSPSGADDLLAVVHMAIYVIEPDGPELISGGAVWLDEPVANQAEGIERLQDLIVANVDAARPAIRRRLGLPPLD
jgi:hypothetical protein